MITLKQANPDDADLRNLIKELDRELAVRDGADHAFYAQFNTIDAVEYAVVAYDGKDAIGCGAIKKFSPDAVEVKRMFVCENSRGRGIASLVLKELERQARELGFRKCILETGLKQPEAIRLYKKNGYEKIPNYGPYAGVDNSVCFEKAL